MSPRPAPVQVRRAYDPPEPEDGTRVLVDRLWPRGLSKESARVDSWPKALTPSTELRRAYHDGTLTQEEFADRYAAELAEPAAAEALTALRALVAAGPVTLLTAVKDPAPAHTTVLLTALTPT
ncbi:DUF488 family protein [Streptomyces sp. NPDC097619]|uniref:DUF488 domain-containing protein n=1 Tax=Streptomyces sp. NPDC097619 TaxID=3157228 RepID=UPI003331E074